MNLKKRALEDTIKRAVTTFPALVLSGPRQSGKTTLLKMLFSKTHKYVNVENPSIRVRAKEDPLAFLAQYSPPVIIDEIQNTPELLSYIKTRIDEEKIPGSWILSGSQNFVLLEKISQTLAGQAAILNLLPFSVGEALNDAYQARDISSWLNNLSSIDTISHQSDRLIDEHLLRGFYPEMVSNKKVDRNIWCNSYITTYLERDVRSLANIGDLNQFERFLISCAVRTGQILNLSDIARTIGISVPTAKRWLSVLEAGFQVYLLYPYYDNINKRLIKSPKIYFNDPALCTYLLGIHTKDTLENNPLFGNIFETMVVSDILKRFYNHGENPRMYYIRTQDGLEVDLVIEDARKLHLFEIKSSMTISPKHASSLLRLNNDLPEKIAQAAIISRSEENFTVTQTIKNYHWKSILSL